MFLKTIDPDKCTSCMQCEAVCTNSQVIVQNEEGLPEFRFDTRCIYCGHCLAICPEDAITFTPLQEPDEEAGTYVAKTVSLASGASVFSPDSVFEFLCSTRSTRIFNTRPVEREKLQTIVDAMARAASAGNEQNRNFCIVTAPQTLDALEQALAQHYAKSLKALRKPVSRTVFIWIGALRAGKQNIGTLETAKMPFKQRRQLMQSILKDAIPTTDSSFSYLKHAPALILVTRGEKYSTMHKEFYRGDASISATFGILMAKALGLASCRMGLLEIALAQDPKLGRLVKLKPGERLDAAVAFGYADLHWRRIPPRGPVRVVWLP
ncbi:MAG: nitroreductase family protein [Clostridiales bacterium]|nr:nitroreductase family protein [Clostridiales bacterium]